ncbi:MAG: O-acetyl-ADP-ribose deacetylase [Thermodesulfobacteriota bacterium]|nr:O-acetyl-ADP-ribose deacetylase [Thermodesulfobacteriota bacterium]
MEVKANQSIVSLVEGDITKEETDVIVNAANSRLAGGGGVDGAIHRAGGPSIMEECRQIGGCPTGKAVITTGGKLKAKNVIHTVGPIYSGGRKNEAELLASAYRESLKLASSKGLESIAFPSISTGAYGYPLSEAANIAINTVLEYVKANTDLKLVRFVLFGRQAYDEYKKTLKALTKG